MDEIQANETKLNLVYDLRIHLGITLVSALVVMFFTNQISEELYLSKGIVGVVLYAISASSLPWLASGILSLVFKFSLFKRLLAAFQLLWICILIYQV